MSLSDRFIRNPVSIASNTSSDGISNLNIIGERRYALRI
jgi:hypothetical protein